MYDKLVKWIIVVVLLVPLVLAAPGSTLTRSFSADSAAPGSDVTVTLHFEEVGEEPSLIINENSPDGLELFVDGNPVQSNNYKKAVIDGLTGTVETGDFTYKLHIPDNAQPGEYNFNGKVTLQAGQQDIAGPATLTVGIQQAEAPQPPPGCANLDTACPAEQVCVVNDCTRDGNRRDGEMCKINANCDANSGLVCIPDGDFKKCAVHQEPGGKCDENVDCQTGSCLDGVCGQPPPPPGQATTVRRSIQPFDGPRGGRVTVTLHVEEVGEEQSLIINEQVPEGLQLIVDGKQVKNNNFKKLFMEGGMGEAPSTKDIQYTVEIPADAELKIHEFSGVYTLQSGQQGIIGDNGVRVVEGAQAPPAARTLVTRSIQPPDAPQGGSATVTLTITEVAEEQSLIINEQVPEGVQLVVDNKVVANNNFKKLFMEGGMGEPPSSQTLTYKINIPENAELKWHEFVGKYTLQSGQFDIGGDNGIKVVAGGAPPQQPPEALPDPVLVPEELKKFLEGQLPRFKPVPTCEGAGCSSVAYSCDPTTNMLTKQSQACANQCSNAQCQAAPPPEPVLMPELIQQWLATAEISTFDPAATCEGENCRKVSYQCSEQNFVTVQEQACAQCPSDECDGIRQPGAQCAGDYDCPGDETCENNECILKPYPAIPLCKSLAINITNAAHHNGALLEPVRQFLGSCIPDGLDAACTGKVNELRGKNDDQLRVAIQDPNNAACFDQVFATAYCFEFDTTNNKDKKDRVRYFDANTKELRVERDVCDGANVNQFQCNENVAAAVAPQACQYGCIVGVCKPQSGCTAPSTGAVRVVTAAGVEIHNPVCTNNVLTRYTCDGQGYTQEDVVCDEGTTCQNGECKAPQVVVQQQGGNDGGNNQAGGGTGGGRRGRGGRGSRLSRQVICGDGLCQAAFGENQLNCPQDCGVPGGPAPAAPARPDDGIATAPSGLPSMPLEDPEAYVPPPAPDEEIPDTYPRQPTGSGPILDIPKEKEPKIWLWIIIICVILGVLGGGGAFAYNYMENKKLAAIPDYKKKKIIDYIKYYSQHGYTRSQLTKHLAQYGVPQKFLDKIYKDLGVPKDPAKPPVPGAAKPAVAAGAAGAAATKPGFMDKLKSFFKKKPEAGKPATPAAAKPAAPAGATKPGFMDKLKAFFKKKPKPPQGGA